MVRKVFEVFDDDKSGEISQRELCELLRVMFPKMKGKQLGKFMTEILTKKITFEVFHHMLQEIVTLRNDLRDAEHVKESESAPRRYRKLSLLSSGAGMFRSTKGSQRGSKAVPSCGAREGSSGSVIDEKGVSQRKVVELSAPASVAATEASVVDSAAGVIEGILAEGTGSNAPGAALASLISAAAPKQISSHALPSPQRLPASLETAAGLIRFDKLEVSASRIGSLCST